MVKKWRSALSVLALAAICSALIFTASTNAENAVFQAVVDEYLSLELDSTHMEVNVLPSEPFASGYVTATVNTNAAAGYTLTFQDADSRNGLEREGYDEATDKSPFNIPSVSVDTTYANLAADTWGYFLGSTTDTEATYKQIPLTATEIASDDEPAADATAKVSFGVKIADTRPSGAYEDTLTLTLTANIIEPTAETYTFDEAFNIAGFTRDSETNKYKMEDMTASVCNSIITGETGILVDARDGTVYHVGKLVDGNCWMLDNLALDLLDSDVQNSLTPQTTNASAEAIRYLLGTTSRDPATDPEGRFATAGVEEFGSALYLKTIPQIEMDYKDEIQTVHGGQLDPLYNEMIEGAWKTGGFYNYCAASAGSYCYDEHESGDDEGDVEIGMDRPGTAIDSEYDICPIGWRLPTGWVDSSSQITDGNEYINLIALLADDDPEFITDYDTVVSVRTTLRLPIASLSEYNREYFLWTSTYNTHNIMSAFLVEVDALNPGNGDIRESGFSVRCIAKGPQE